MGSADIGHLRTTVNIAWLLLALILTALPAYGQEAQQNNTWYWRSNSDTVFIFVHGLFSNANACWIAPNKAYWPEILKTDTRFGDPNIFLGGYYTKPTSGVYGIRDAADELLSHLRVKNPQGIEGPLSKQKIVFIAHSTGGLVVRYLLERERELFKDKIIGLVLLASPSRGSAWSNRFKWLKEIYGNKMVGELARYNAFTMDLDQSFAALVGSKKLQLVGVDIFESKFIISGMVGLSERIVPAEDQASYFGAYKIIPDSDHFSIVKPMSVTHESHQRLYEFYETTYLPFVAVAGKTSNIGPSPSTPWIEVTKSTLIVQRPLLSDEFKMKNIKDKPVQWFFKDFPNQIVSLHGHAMEGTLEPNGWSDQLPVRGHSDQIIAQTTREHVFFIIEHYGNFSSQEKIKVITDDPNELRKWFLQQISPPSPR
jgi:pimeloyl-ACP methyl ester carboxylesterase